MPTTHVALKRRTFGFAMTDIVARLIGCSLQTTNEVAELVLLSRRCSIDAFLCVTFLMIVHVHFTWSLAEVEHVARGRRLRVNHWRGKLLVVGLHVVHLGLRDGPLLSEPLAGTCHGSTVIYRAASVRLHEPLHGLVHSWTVGPVGALNGRPNFDVITVL